MRKKAQAQSERIKAAVERNPKRGPGAAKSATKRAGGPLSALSAGAKPSIVKKAKKEEAMMSEFETRVVAGGSVHKITRDAVTGEFVSKAEAKRRPKETVTETVGKKGKAKPRKSKEPRYVLVLQEKGDKEFDEALTKGEMLAFLAEGLINEDTGEVDETGGVPHFEDPENPAVAADLLYTTRQRRLKHDHASKAMKLYETALREYLINNLPKSSATGAAGRVARAQIETEDTPVVGDWDALRAHIKKTGNFDLLNKAVNRRAVKERWNAGKQVPGVDHFQVVKVSITKV